jgi:serine/threonine protein kinase
MAAARKYAEGVELALSPVHKFSTVEKLCVLTVTKIIKVENTRRSQVVLAVMKEGEASPIARNVDSLQTGSSVILKIFDPEFYHPEAGTDGGPDCGSLASREAQAYRKLSPLNGSRVPIFYGLYSLSDSFVIMLEYVKLTNLSDQNSNPLPNELAALINAGTSLLTELHTVGVYHLDIRVDNLFWDGEKIMIIDFEASQYCTDEDKRTLLAQMDFVDMWRVLQDCGAIAPWERV